MKTILPTRPATLILLLLLAGCGGDDTQATDPGDPRPKAQAPEPGEVVVEPSTPTIIIDNEPRPTLDIVRALLTADPAPTPEGYTLRIDDAYPRENRLRFVVSPKDKQDDDATKQAAGEAYDALAAAFATQSEAALRAELVQTQQQFDQASQARQAAQDAMRNYLANRSGLPDTNESRLEKRRLDLHIQQALDKQRALGEQAQSLQKQIDRERWPTLRRIR